MGRVRTLVEADVEQVTTLHRTVYGEEASRPALQQFLADIFLRHPWIDEEVPSLVYEDAKGRIVGVLGAMQRPMTIEGRRLRAIVTHDFMVEPQSRATMAALELMKRIAKGPQDLVLCDGNDQSRTLWEALDGSIAFGHSLRWIRPLRPVQFVLTHWSGRSTDRGLAAAVRPLARVFDAALCRFSASPFRRPRLSSDGAPLEVSDLLRALGEVSRRYSLRPCYDEPSLAWLLEILGRSTRQGALRQRKVTGDDGAILGWFLYRAKRGGIGEVVQLAGRRGAIPRVVDHLFEDAWREGCVAVSGQVQPELYRPLSQKRCFFDNAGFWLLYGTSDGDVREALQSGDVFLTRLECEGWMRLAF
ncbi:MAG TPA: GNAT family N-acetyltransferase [Thermoanaerobaculia bacterium]|nr:GNAT family N-acetyltransferase [Thermoanaerobaculia bacterium]